MKERICPALTLSANLLMLFINVAFPHFHRFSVYLRKVFAGMRLRYRRDFFQLPLNWIYG